MVSSSASLQGKLSCGILEPRAKEGQQLSPGFPQGAPVVPAKGRSVVGSEWHCQACPFPLEWLRGQDAGWACSPSAGGPVGLSSCPSHSKDRALLLRLPGKRGFPCHPLSSCERLRHRRSLGKDSHKKQGHSQSRDEPSVCGAAGSFTWCKPPPPPQTRKTPLRFCALTDLHSTIAFPAVPRAPLPTACPCWSWRCPSTA